VRIWTAERPNRIGYQSICYLKEIRKHRARICIARRSSRRTGESDRFFKKFVNRRACICSAGCSDQFGHPSDRCVKKFGNRRSRICTAVRSSILNLTAFFPRYISSLSSLVFCFWCIASRLYEFHDSSRIMIHSLSISRLSIFAEMCETLDDRFLAIDSSLMWFDFYRRLSISFS